MITSSVNQTETAHEQRIEAVAAHVREILRLLGEDVSREGLADTPLRVAKMYEELLAGMTVDPDSVLSTTFEEKTDGPVVVADIIFYSLCEHHMLPFFGTAHVAYLPADRIVGLSKIARLVEVVSRRLQVQERMTEQIADSIDRVLKPHGVMVLVEAEHLCMCARGVKKPGSRTVTTAVRGQYRDDATLRAEFFRLLERRTGV
ncbi:MAG: GTP cyclohydrolase I FolE [Thermoflavifilum sp.]|nr:GTP cyclohydrolase I FolE [Thermoflavifilum sp.]MCL6513884.1 GTP cyclohydrolase I FolE [Alicyclobacillus sp.]